MNNKQQTEAAEAANAAVTIKKYPNRRLYDTHRSEYVTLDDLCKLVQENIEFEVVDAKTGEDLTRATLTQIIFEQESKGYNLLPVSFLRSIIGFYGNNLGTMLPSYLEQAMENFVKHEDSMRSYMGSFSDFSPFKTMQEISKQNMEVFEKTMTMWNPFAPGDGDNDEDPGQE